MKKENIEETDLIGPGFQTFLANKPTGSKAGKKVRPKQKSYRKKVESAWSYEKIMKLIQSVEVRRALWDASCAGYKLSKDILWQEVADSIPATVNDCKGKWANLRTTFNFNLEKLRKKKSRQDTDEEFQIVWRFFKPMTFLGNMKVRKATQSVSSTQLEPESTDESLINDVGYSEESATCTSGQQRSRKSTPTMSTAMDALQPLQSNDYSPKDTATAFGDYVAAELRSLPPELAAFARAKLRRAFNDILDEVVLMIPQYQQI